MNATIHLINALIASAMFHHERAVNIMSGELTQGGRLMVVNHCYKRDAALKTLHGLVKGNE